MAPEELTEGQKRDLEEHRAAVARIGDELLEVFDVYERPTATKNPSTWLEGMLRGKKRNGRTLIWQK